MSDPDADDDADADVNADEDEETNANAYHVWADSDPGHCTEGINYSSRSCSWSIKVILIFQLVQTNKIVFSLPFHVDAPGEKFN